MRFTRAIAVSATLATLLGAGCRPPITKLAVPLVYRPTNTLHLEQIDGGVKNAAPLGLAVTDDRADKSAVGKNAEKEGHSIPIVADGSTPEQFLRDAVGRALGQAGVTIAPEAGQARCTLRLSITSFWTEETGLYRGSIGANASLVTRGGRALWGGNASGQAKRFGRSLSAENYQETFSDASVEMVQNLLGNAGFRSALPCTEAQREKPAETEKPRRKRH